MIRPSPKTGIDRAALICAAAGRFQFSTWGMFDSEWSLPTAGLCAQLATMASAPAASAMRAWAMASSMVSPPSLPISRLSSLIHTG